MMTSTSPPPPDRPSGPDPTRTSHWRPVRQLLDAMDDDLARSREIVLTDDALELVPPLEAEWMATERAVAELEDEVPYPLTRVVQDLEEALQRRPFRDRVADHLPPDVEP